MSVVPLAVSQQDEHKGILLKTLHKHQVVELEKKISNLGKLSLEQMATNGHDDNMPVGHLV